jgi:hypothetical protein
MSEEHLRLPLLRPNASTTASTDTEQFCHSPLHDPGRMRLKATLALAADCGRITDTEGKSEASRAFGNATFLGSVNELSFGFGQILKRSRARARASAGLLFVVTFVSHLKTWIYRG